MIGIVIVSHSHALGEAVAGLAREMAGGSAPSIAVAAGLDETTFGTDATAVSAAIEQVGADGNDVLVLVDIGSSVLSAEMACELVDPDFAERVRISAAPLVEGIIPAVVSAASGATLDEVAAEADDGLDAKRAHLGVADGAGQAPEGEPVSGTAPGLDTPPPLRSSGTRPASIDITITDPHGLHARPAAKLVALVRSYDADVTLTDLGAGTGPVPATSMSKVATLNAGHGARLQVAASGPQTDEVLAAVQELVGRDFEDAAAATASETATDDTTPVVTPSETRAQGSGLEAALGPAHVVEVEVNLDGYQQGSVAQEQQRSSDAVAALAEDLRRRSGGGLDTGSASASPYSTSLGEGSASSAAGPSSEVADILAAHLVLLEDDAILEDVGARIERGEAAPAAWSAVLQALEADFAGLADAYQRARAQDVRAIERQLLRALADGPESLAGQDDTAPAGSVLVIDELDPATASSLDAGSVAGIVTVRGGSTGHGVIIARSRGIPIYTDGGDTAARIEEGQRVGFDTPTGLLVVDPSSEQEAHLTQLLDRRRIDAEEADRLADTPAETSDGTRVRVGANLTGRADAAAAAAHGAEGSGLVRTEILFGDAPTLPSADDQAAAFVALGQQLGGEPITIRTWDVGGDKPLPFLPGAREANPMLGVRGLRMFRHTPDPLDEQLAAVCAAAAQTPVRVMFPMVSTRGEVDWALGRLAQARAKAGDPEIPVGIMVEVPAAAVRVAELARGLDFVSIGTNDLTQYTLAADRGNAGVGELADGLDPAVLQLIRQVADNVPDGVEVGVCGDLASNADAAPLLIGLGVDDLSVVGPRIPLVKQAIRHTSMDDAKRLADRALQAGSARAVRELLAAPR